MLGVISGALHIGDHQIQECFQMFQTSLERGQILPATSLKNHVDVEFISEGIKYNVKVVKTGPNNYFICMNDSMLEVEAHRLSDGGLLISFDGASFTTYMKDQVSSYRITIGNKTSVLHKENDPTKLSYRITIGNKTCVLHKENDPTKLSYRITIGNKTCVLDKENDQTKLRYCIKQLQDYYRKQDLCTTQREQPYQTQLQDYFRKQDPVSFIRRMILPNS
ncbi:acetyl-CoA carboxylase 1-like, partial [Saccostrea cucullata]|uniref:acetyl-CoA carboxylase 1-like n=1 Tax=Saccostrea cuccullata TaxID=36930 RepID=UPI002ED211DF